VLGLHLVSTTLNRWLTIRVASHYDRRSRGCQFPPIKLQETKNLASRPFTLKAKVQSPKAIAIQNVYMAILSDQGTLGLAFGGSTLCPAKGSSPYIFIGYFQPISLDYQQSLHIQSHALLTLTTIV
jgi:hypothetical protein